MEISENEILKYAVQNDMIDMDIIRLQIEMDERKQLLARHMYDIWQGKDNKFYTYLPDEKKGRVASGKMYDDEDEPWEDYE